MAETLLTRSPQPVTILMFVLLQPQVIVQSTLELYLYLFVVLRLVSLAVALLCSTVGVVVLWETSHDVLHSR